MGTRDLEQHCDIDTLIQGGGSDFDGAEQPYPKARLEKARENVGETLIEL